jgi:DNA helicase-4
MTVTYWSICASALIIGISAFFFVTLSSRRSRLHAATLKLSDLQTRIHSAVTEWHHPAGKDQYLTEPQHRSWAKEHSGLMSDLHMISQQLPEESLGNVSIELISIWKGRDEARNARNASWVALQRRKHVDLFTNGMGYPLNTDQVNAILNDEHRSLVVAGAGTGKTSTIVAKVRWILAQGLTEPTSIRILAFNKKAAAEVGERLDGNESGDGITSTFHALGLGLAAQARGEKPRLSSLEEDARLLQTFIRKCIEDGLKTPKVANHVIEFLTFFRYPDQNPAPAAESYEANRWADGHNIQSLTGVKLRSNSEAIIANWLTINGIEWIYEDKYILDTATIRYGQYRPDFYLPKCKIYIEHWACDRAGRLPPSWTTAQQLQYKDGMRWKRELHNRHQTVLIETYSDINGRRTIAESLDQALTALRVTPKLLSKEDVDALVMTNEIIDPVVTLTQNFLKLYRECETTIDDLRKRLDRNRSARELAFLNMFEWIHGRYVKHLEAEGTIDFSDMIREAAEALRANRVKLSLDYLLVDEFQDISRGRTQLIRAILDQNPSCRLVAVGDDWQSINRFAGSDIQVMVDFEKEFGHTKRTDLRQTHRFGSKLLTATSKFVQINPQQLAKQLIAARTDQYPAIEIVSTEKLSSSIQRTRTTKRSAGQSSESEITATGLREVLRRIAEENERASVLVLGRYRYLKQRLDEASPLPKNLDVEFSTVHSAKGREADYAVLVDVVTGRLGFPSEIEDDPIMNLVLANMAGFPNAEERRVLYVALTRARIKSFVITDDLRRSAFIDELEGRDYDGLVIGSGAAERAANCPVCESGRLQLRTGAYGPFYACVSERCAGKAAKCPHCGGGGFLRNDSGHSCLLCGKTAENCPNCSLGFLKHIPGGANYQAFDACSTNSRNPTYRCFVRNPCRCQLETA